ncbi:MAG: site-specific integrase [Agriterribacter sp.]
MKGQKAHTKYNTVYNHLSEFIKLRYHREDLAFRELNNDFIREFDFFLRIDKECTHNTVWVYTMPVIALAKLGVKNKLIRDNPFEDYEISMEETDRTYLLKEAVETLMLLKPFKRKRELVKDLFIFSCFTGLSYIDIKKLKWSNIQSFFDGHQWIISRRKKSDVASNVRLMEVPKYIIEKYRGVTRNDLIFPVPTNATCNRHVSKLIEEAEIVTEQKVTFHTARHTFATMFLTEGVPLESISKMMGHKNISTTQIYAKITSQKISKDMDLVAPKFAAMESAFVTMQSKNALPEAIVMDVEELELAI